MLTAARANPEQQHMTEWADHLGPVVDALHGLPVDQETLRLHSQWVKAMLSMGRTQFDDLIDRLDRDAQAGI